MSQSLKMQSTKTFPFRLAFFRSSLSNVQRLYSDARRPVVPISETVKVWSSTKAFAEDQRCRYPKQLRSYPLRTALLKTGPAQPFECARPIRLCTFPLVGHRTFRSCLLRPAPRDCCSHRCLRIRRLSWPRSLWRSPQSPSPIGQCQVEQ